MEKGRKDALSTSNRIQNIGAILVTDVTLNLVTHASTATGKMFDIAPASIVGTPLTDFLTQDMRHTIANVLGHPTIAQKREVLPVFVLHDITYHMFLHRRAEQVILEFLPEPATWDSWQTPLELAKPFLTVPMDQAAPLDFWKEVVERLRGVLAMDRLTVHKLLANSDSKVIVEARHPAMPSLLGQTSSADTIPEPLRALYLHSPIRFISDINAEDTPPIQMEGADPLDLSLSVLRGTSEVERTYLRSLNVVGALTIPIVVDGNLWGLIAAHHRTPTRADPSTLNAMEFIGKLITLRL